MARLWKRIEKPVSTAAVIVVAVLLWQFSVEFFNVPRFILPTPTMVLDQLLETPAFFAQQTMFTLWTTVAGFGLAVVGGIALAIAIVYSPLMERTIFTLLLTLNSVPKVALAPLFVIWMGTGSQPKIAIALTIAIFSIVIDTVLGLRSVEPELLDLARSTRTSELKVLAKIRFPSALPAIFSGLKISISVALVGAVVGEFVAGNRGLGQVVLIAQGNFQTARMFAAIVILGALGMLLFYLVHLAESLVIPWHISQRGGRH